MRQFHAIWALFQTPGRFFPSPKSPINLALFGRFSNFVRILNFYSMKQLLMLIFWHFREHFKNSRQKNGWLHQKILIWAILLEPKYQTISSLIMLEGLDIYILQPHKPKKTKSSLKRPLFVPKLIGHQIGQFFKYFRRFLYQKTRSPWERESQCILIGGRWANKYDVSDMYKQTYLARIKAHFPAIQSPRDG